jgi:hypothetical protein
VFYPYDRNSNNVGWLVGYNVGWLVGYNVVSKHPKITLKDDSNQYWLKSVVWF